MNITEFRRDINSSDLVTNTATKIENLVHQYNKCLSELLEKHTPMQVKKLSTNSKFLWFDNKIKNQKVICRRAEQRWLKTRKQADLDNFKSCRNFLHRTIHESKLQYHTSLINADTSKNRLFKIVDSINNKQKETPVLPDINPEDLPNGFSN